MRLAAVLLVLGVVAVSPVATADPWDPFLIQLSKDSIPADAPPDVREQIERLYSGKRAEQDQAAVALGHMGPRGAPAIPFLVDTLREAHAGTNTRGWGTITGPAGSVAARALSGIGAAAVDPLVAVLRSSEEYTQRANAVAALAWLNDPRALDAAIAALADKDLWVRMTAADRLAERGKAITDRMLPLLAGPDAGLRGGAAHVLGHVADPRVIEPLVRAAQDSHPEVRRAVVEALGCKHDRRCLDALRGTLADPDAANRRAALWALPNFDDPRVPTTVRGLIDDPDAKVRAAALGLLGSTRDPAFTPVFARVLADAGRTDRDCVDAAIGGLGRIGGPEAVAALNEFVLHGPQGWEYTLARAYVFYADESSVGPLLRLLSSDASLALGRTRAPEAVPGLLQFLTTSTSNDHREEAVRALGQIGDPRAAGALLDVVLSERDPGVASAARYALARSLTPEVEARLVELLRSTDPRERAKAALVFAHSGDKRHEGYVIGALGDDDSTVRRDVAHALGRMRSIDAVPALTLALDDKDREVWRAAATALCTLASPLGFPDLFGGRGDDADLRQGAALALALLAKPQEAAPLVACLQDPSGRVPDVVFVALVRLHDPEAVPALLRVLQDDRSPVRASAAWALGQLRAHEGHEALVSALGAENPQTRSTAARALGTLGDRRAREHLVRLLDDEDTSVRGAAIRALGELGDRRAVPALLAHAADERLWRDCDLRLRDTVWRPLAVALGKLGDTRAVPCLARLLDTQDLETRIHVCIALRRLGGPEAQRALKTAKDDTSLPVRWAAAIALGETLSADDLTRLRLPMTQLGAPWEEHSNLKYLVRVEMGDTSVVSDILKYGHDESHIPSGYEEYFDMLRKVTGKDLGDDWLTWRRWWEARQAADTPPR